MVKRAVNPERNVNIFEGALVLKNKDLLRIENININSVKILPINQLVRRISGEKR